MSWLQITSLIEAHHLISHGPHYSLSRWNPHEPGKQAFPQGSQTLLSVYCSYRMEHACVPDVTSFSLCHQPSLHDIEGSCANRSCSSCKKA
uniref:Uncharacterized protein n=1 Tax=Arundo donax TaxID=35708 RepID=A0A0A9GV51_ARUDO